MIPVFWAAWLTLVFAALTPAWAHNAPSGASYEWNPCCSNQDCAPIPDHLVHEIGPGLIAVRVPPGAHPMHGPGKATDLYLEFDGDRIRQPIDGQWHVCINPAGAPLCVYPPRRSM